MNPLDPIHGRLVHQRRVRVLLRHLIELLPPGPATLVDVGCGDGLLTALVNEARPEISVSGVDVLVRPDARISVTGFDGRRLPFADRSFDYATLIDVLHHTEDPAMLVRECSRVCRRGILIKDHRREGWAAGTILRLMDWVGNSRHGVVLPYNYLGDCQWEDLYRGCSLEVVEQRRDLGIYPPWADWLFGNGLHLFLHVRPAGLGNSEVALA